MIKKLREYIENCCLISTTITEELRREKKYARRLIADWDGNGMEMGPRFTGTVRDQDRASRDQDGNGCLQERAAAGIDN